jgi:hypothetical protein
VAISDELLKALGQLTITFGAFDADVSWLAEILDRRGRDIAGKELANWTVGQKIAHLKKEIEQIAPSCGMADDSLTMQLRALIPELRSITERRNHLVHNAMSYEPITDAEFMSRRGETLELTPDLVWELIGRIRNVLPDVITLGLAFWKEWRQRVQGESDHVRH